MQLSAKKNRDLTALEVQAQQIVNEEDDEPEVTDQQKYAQILEKRKDRRAGETLYDFLERQVKDQMRSALGQPLQNVSNELLNKVVTKEVQQNLKKYKMAVGKTPSKTGGKGDNASPPRVRLQSPGGRTTWAGEEDQFNPKFARELLKQLDQGIHDKVALLKMMIIKCNEYDGNIKKIRALFNKADLVNADKYILIYLNRIIRVLTGMETLNLTTLKDIQSEVNSKVNLMDVVGQLQEEIFKGKGPTNQSQLTRSIAKERSEQQTLQRKVDELQQRIREYEHGNTINKSASKAPPVSRDLINSLNEADSQVSDLRKKLDLLEGENADLRGELRNVVDDFKREVSRKDTEIRMLQADGQASEVKHLLQKEIDNLHSENRMLRDKLNSTQDELLNKKRGQSQRDQGVEQEIHALRQKLQDKEHEYRQQVDYFRNLLSDKDNSITKQKNEWAEIYGNMKQEIEDLKRDLKVMHQENDNLRKSLDMGGKGGATDRDIAKKLKKRELECSALWETLRDMHVSSRQVFDARQLQDLLALRALDTKAKRKLKM